MRVCCYCERGAKKEGMNLARSKEPYPPPWLEDECLFEKVGLLECTLMTFSD